jgi:DUF1680 family protein
LQEYVRGVLDKILAAQWDDGYLYTYYSVPLHQENKRWSNIKDEHELYCAGHYIEAAVAWHETTGDDDVLAAAVKLGDHIRSVFGPGKRHDVPGHPEIELALVRLYEATGDANYVDMAKFFIDERGHAHQRDLYGPDLQDHEPVFKQAEVVGHAVRACYLYSGIADVGAQTDDLDYQRAAERLWINMTNKHIYLTGGIGARHQAESFGQAYELPNKSAYCETCAAIANAMWNWRMFLNTGDGKYIDLFERILYNGFLAGVSLEGNTFFYPNPLEADGEYPFNKGSGKRRTWFSCACCPPNAARFMASLPGYVYARRENDIYVNLFVQSEATFVIRGVNVTIRQETDYPWNGNVLIVVEPETPVEFEIFLRIPSWADNKPMVSDLYRYKRRVGSGMNMKVGDLSVRLQMRKGYARMSQQWGRGDAISAHFPMPIRYVLAHDKVEADAGKVGLERGPIVYCAEGIDNGGTVSNIVLSNEAELEAQYRAGLLGGIAVLGGSAYGLYSGPDPSYPVLKKQEFLAIPYYAWCHRGIGPMAVWLARTPSVAQIADENWQ